MRKPLEILEMALNDTIGRQGGGTNRRRSLYMYNIRHNSIRKV